MHTSNTSSGRYNQEPPPPPYNHTSHSSSSQAGNSNATAGNRNQQASEGDENLTPRQEPQGEESKLQEASQCLKQGHSQQSYTQYLRQQAANTADDKPTAAVSKRHKPQSNSMPVQSSQFIQHGVNALQSRSLDSSSTSQIDNKIYTVSLPHYFHPPAYGSAIATAATTQKSVVLDRQTSGNSISNGLPQHVMAINSNNVNLATAYNQGDDQLLPPPPEYPGNRADVRRSYEVLDHASSMSQNAGISLSQSSSQPELSNMVPSTIGQQQVLTSSNGVKASSSQSHHNASHSSKGQQQQDFAAVATRASQMVEILSEENKSLRNELESYYKKATRLQKIEFELQKVHEAHDNLVKSSVKKESLEKAIRMRQDLDIRQLEESNHHNHERAIMLEKTLTDQTSMLNDLSKLISNHEETIVHLNKLTAEQKDIISSGQSMARGLTTELEAERARAKILEEELNAYKSNTSATMEEESEVKMAALTQSTKDSERIIIEAQAEKLKYMDEAHQACKKVANLEAKLKTLEASCAEKDAIVRVLQRRQRTNLSGRGRTSPQLTSVQHTRRISEPSSVSTQRASQRSIENNTAAGGQHIPDDCLQTQTWQV